MTYEIRIERTANGYSAHVPELPGCIAAAETREETEQLIHEAIVFHLEGLMLRRSLVAITPITVKSNAAIIWSTENTPTLYVDIQAPASHSLALTSAQVAFGSIGATA